MRIYRCNIAANPKRIEEWKAMGTFKQPYDGLWDDGSREDVLLTEADVIKFTKTGRLMRTVLVGTLAEISEFDGKDPAMILDIDLSKATVEARTPSLHAVYKAMFFKLLQQTAEYAMDHANVLRLKLPNGLDPDEFRGIRGVFIVENSK